MMRAGCWRETGANSGNSVRQAEAARWSPGTAGFERVNPVEGFTVFHAIDFFSCFGVGYFVSYWSFALFVRHRTGAREGEIFWVASSHDDRRGIESFSTVFLFPSR